MPATAIKFPPIDFVAWENTVTVPRSKSRDLGGNTRFSQTQVKRRMLTAQYHMAANERAAGGYIEALKLYLSEQDHPFVEMVLYPAVWHGAIWGRELYGERLAVWTSGGYGADWQDEDGVAAQWHTGDPLTGTPNAAGPFPFVTVTGFPAGVSIFPSERIQIGGSIYTVSRKVTTTGGPVDIFLIETPSEIGAQDVVLYPHESGVFEILDMPRAVQTSGASDKYQFPLRECLSSAYGGFTVINPW